MASDMLMSGTSSRITTMTRVKTGSELGKEKAGGYSDRGADSIF